MKRNTNILFFGLGSIGQRHLRNLKKELIKYPIKRENNYDRIK